MTECTRLAIAGATGRTGRRILEAALDDPRFEIVRALTVATDPWCGRALPVHDTMVPLSDDVPDDCTFDAFVDFTLPEGTMRWLKVCLEQRRPMIIGTTGLSGMEETKVRKAAQSIAIVRSPNFSIGVQVLRQAAQLLARQLGAEFDIEIVETHHRHKVDAPSGTALELLDDLLAVHGRRREQDANFGRAGQPGARPEGQIGVHAVRMGEIIGKHEVQFGGSGETVTLSHTVHSRAAFAAGALRAAAWVRHQPPGLYSFADVLAP
jgi:4-hydroxy-tetrahydrodipicolinate reductase